MNELFRLKIASKRQMTAPQRLLDALGLSEGDEIQIEVANGQVVDVHPCKAVPTALLTRDLLSKIREREDRLLQGQGMTADEALHEVTNKLKAKAAVKQNQGSGENGVAKQRTNREERVAKSRG